MSDLEKQIAEWRRQMLAAGIKSPAPLEELESHLRDEVAQQMRSGLSAPEAFASAIERVGPTAALKNEFEKFGGTKEARLRKCLWKGFALGVGLFVAGISLGYFVVLPSIMRANEHYAAWLGVQAPQWSGVPYNNSLVWKLMFGFGAVFGLPVGLLTLINVGILDYRRLVNARRYVLVFNLILGALLTTPDVVTQLVMFIPLQLSYEVSVWLAWYSQRRKAINS